MFFGSFVGSIGLVLALSSVSFGAQEDERERAERALEKHELYLARKPYQDWALDKLVEEAVALNRLDALVRRYEERLVAEPDDEPLRIVLARLYARVDRLEPALATLAPLAEHADAELLRLRGDLLLASGKTKEAIEALDAAAAATQDTQLLETIHALRGQAFLAEGDRARAHEAFHALAELDPDSFTARMDAAATLARHGMADEALAEYAIAERLAGEDAPRVCRVLAEMGRLYEQLARGKDALAAYARAIGRMARGNWLKRELEERVLALHRRTGELAELVSHAREQAGARPEDLDAREFLARALEASGAQEEALATLDASIADFPADLELSRHRMALLRSLGKQDELALEYQRILGEHPDELELYFELGQVLASEGKLEQARLQWERTLEKRLDDADLCSRLAGFHALYGQPEEALAMYERAITIEPREVAHYADVARFLAARDRSAEIPAWLERAEAAAGTDVAPWEEIATLWNEHGHPDRARAGLEKALALEGGANPRLLGALAQAQIDAGDHAAATDSLHRVIELADEPMLRSSATDRLIALFRKRQLLDELLALEERRLEEGEAPEATLLVLGKLHLQRREPERALERLTELLARDASNEVARMLLARLHEELGDPRAALAAHEELSRLRPQYRRRCLKEMARLHLVLYEQDQAFACYDEILRAAPDNAASFREVADAYERLGLHERVVELLRQAVRLEPEDGRLRLDLAETLSLLGERDKAREEVRLAIASRDEDTREKARERYYEMLAEGGEVESEIERLRERIEQNPYDVEAPLLLADLFERESEYELALEMLGGLLAYQPREPRLLLRRAELQILVERPAEAIADLELLRSLPDTDQDRLAFAIAGAALASCDRERAEELLGAQGDPLRVARFWSEHDEPRPAVAVLERALQRQPGDKRVVRELVNLLEELGDREAAAKHIERLVDADGDSWTLLVRLGELYHGMGRSEDVIACGRRLFALLRVEEEKEAEELKKPTTTVSYSFTTSWRAPGVAQRLSELDGYFNTKNLRGEFGRLGAEEVRVQPTNAMLLARVVSNLQRQEGQRPLARELIALARQATLGAGRIPPEYEADAWERMLAGYEINLYRDDAAFAGARIDELRARVGGGSASENEVLELGLLCSMHRREAEQIEVLRMSLDRVPDSERIAAGLASAWMKQKEYARAAEVLEPALGLFDEAAAAAELDRKAETEFPRSRLSLLARMPIQARRRATEEDVRRIVAAQRLQPLSLGWAANETIYPQGVRRALATCYAKTGRAEEARAMLRSLEPKSPDSFMAWTQIANAYFEEELFDEAEGLYRRLLEMEAELLRHPVLGWLTDWSGQLATPMANFARILERRGALVEAYDVLRTYGSDPAPAELLLHTHDAFSAARKQYTARMAAEEASWSGADAPSKKAWREAAVRLAEIHQYQKDWTAALLVYQRVAAELPEDMPVRGVIAQLLLRTGERDRAIEERRAIIAEKRELNRRWGRQETPLGRTTTPRPLPLEQDPNSYAWNNLRNASRYRYRGNPMGGAQPHDLVEDYGEILRIHLDQRELSAAAGILRDLAREDVQTFRYLRYSLREILGTYRFGKEALPVWRLMRATDPDDDSFAFEYAQALVETDELEEARRVLQKAASRAAQDWQAEQARDQLVEIERRLGLDERRGPDELAAAVEADPKSVKKRLELARYLFDERRVEEALEHAIAAEELAPGQDEARDLALRCHQQLGHHEEVEARVLERFEKETDPEQSLALATQLANWMWERGEEERVHELFARAMARATRSYLNPTPAAWYAVRGRFDEARELLERELERFKQSGVVSSSIDPRRDISRLQVWEGDAAAMLLAGTREIEEQDTMAEKLALFPGLVTAAGELPDPAAQHAAIEASFSAEAPRPRAMIAAVLALAEGDLPGGERALHELARTDPDARFLYPALVTLARGRDDWRAALGYLQEIEAAGLASATILVTTRVGGISERQALQAEMADLHARLGEIERARELWSSLFEADDVQKKRKLATLLAGNDLVDEARETLRGYLAEVGERAIDDLLFLAELDGRAKDHDARIATLRKAEVLVRDDDQYQVRSLRQELLDAHRRAGKLPELRDELRAAFEKDPEDTASARLLIGVEIELGDEDAALALLERLAPEPAFAEVLLPLLAEERLLRGDLEGGKAALTLVLEQAEDQWMRDQWARQLAELQARAGDVEQALAILEEHLENPEGAQAQLQIAEALVRWKRPEEALARFERSFALSDDPFLWRDSYVELLIDLGRKREALDALYTEFEERPVTTYGSSERVASLARELGEEARLAELLAASPQDPLLLRRAGVVAIELGKPVDAARSFESLLAVDPDDRGALAGAIRCYEELDRRGDALRACERLLVLLDRDRAFLAGADSIGMQVPMQRQRRIALLVKEGRLDEARAAASDRLGRRYEAVERYFGSSSLQLPTDDLQAYAQALALEGLEGEEMRVREEIARMQGRTDLVWLASHHRRQGDLARAEEILWKSLEPPVSTVFGDGTGQDHMADPYFGFQSAGYGYGDVSHQLLVIARERGTVDELVARMKERAGRLPEDSRLAGQFRSLLQEAERWEELLAVEEEDLDDAALDARDLATLALIHRELGHYERAIEYLERVERTERAARWSDGNQYTMSRTTGLPATMRFTWGKQGSTSFSSGGGSSMSSWRAGGDLDGVVQRIALHAKLGDTERAAELEREHLARYERMPWGGDVSYGWYMTSWSGEPWPALASAHRELELWDRAEEYLRRGLEAVEPEARGSLHEALVELQAERGDVEAEREALAGWIAWHDERVAAEPLRAGPLLARARARADHGGDAAAARADLERALELSPGLAKSSLDVAWIWLHVGEAERALAVVRDLARGLRGDAEHGYPLGIATALAEGIDAARPILRRALAEDPDHRAAARARALLQE